MTSNIDWETFQPRNLGQGLVSNTSCEIFGWGSAPTIIRRSEMRVYGPAFCDSQFAQVFCSIIPASNDERCTAEFGSPIMCNQQADFSGFYILNTLLTNRLCFPDNSNRFALQMHSVADFRDWIDGVSAGESIKVSLGLLVVFLVAIMRI